jgi:hypothetical protein
MLVHAKVLAFTYIQVGFTQEHISIIKLGHRTWIFVLAAVRGSITACIIIPATLMFIQVMLFDPLV